MHQTNTDLNFWRGRPVFVTGATGFLGGWLVEGLLARGAEVVALVRDEVPHALLFRDGLQHRATVVHGSLQDQTLIRRALAEYSVDTVFHLAAQSQVGVAKRDPVGTLEANVSGTWNVLEACRQLGVKRVLVASSDKAYGRQTLPYVETQALDGEYPYDVSKSCADLISRMYAVAYSLPVAIVRCANLFGGGDLNFERLIPGLIRAIAQDQPFVIRSDGKFIRDYLYIKDAVSAYLMLAERLLDMQLQGEAFNFSMEIRATVLDVVEEVLSITERQDLKPIVQNQANNEIREQYLSIEKARRVLGWAPRYTLREALAETIGWYNGLFETDVVRKKAAREQESALQNA